MKILGFTKCKIPAEINKKERINFEYAIFIFYN